MYYVPLLKIVLIGLIMVILRLPDLLVDRFVGNYKHRSVSLQDAKLNNIRVNFTCCSVYLIKHTLSDVELAFFLSATKIHTSKRMNFESKLHRAKPSAITCNYLCIPFIWSHTIQNSSSVFLATAVSLSHNSIRPTYVQMKRFPYLLQSGL